MAKIKRFSYVSAPGSSVAHYHFNKLLEGELTKCGLRLQKGWKYGPLAPRRRCKRCASAL